MKIGILTYHRAHNYGAMLQAYALRTYLQAQGHEVEFIDYWPTGHAKEYNWLRSIKGHTQRERCVYLLYLVLTAIRRAFRIHKFEKFRELYLQLPSQPRYTQYGATINESYDLVIVGSDQIWRNHCTTLEHIGFDPVYFCQTLNHPAHCATYAASMGVIRMSDSEEKQLKQYLSCFSSLSVREKTLLQKLAELGFESTLVCDPTLLLSKEQWNTLLPKKRFRNAPYVLYYEMTQSGVSRQYAQIVAKEHHCELLIISATLHTMWRSNELTNIGPIELIHAIRDAEFVVSTSFHGTAFSVIFEKQFISMGARNNSDRIQTLLTQINIPDHYTTIPPVAYTPIDIDAAHKKLETYTHHSKQYINAIQQ